MKSRDAEVFDVALRLGARLRRASAAEWAGPCPVCGGRDRFAVSPGRNLWNCRGCAKGGDAIDLARHALGLGFAEAVRFVGVELSPAAPERRAPLAPAAPVAIDEKRIADAVALFRESDNPIGTAADVYMRSRGLEMDDLAGRAIRWNSRIGAMVALFRNIETGQPRAVARTFLDAEARKIDRKFLGPVGGAAVMLDGFAEVTGGLHIGEGVETCQAARQLGLRPTWAVGSAGAVAAFPILAGVECLTLLAENDDASARAVRACGKRWHEAGREVFVNRPIGGNDLNDALRRAS